MVDRSSRRDLTRSTANLQAPPSCGGSCAQNNGANHGNRDLLHRLQVLDFSIYDTILYLDAYPDSADAMAYYKKLIAERDSLVRALSASHNSPNTAFDNVGDEWDWVKSPWPWEASAN